VRSDHLKLETRNSKLETDCPGVSPMTHRYWIEHAARARGSAMMEMALVLPFIVLIIALLLFFGRGIMRVEHAQVVDRYEAWRIAENAPGAGAYRGGPSYNPVPDPDGQLMNQAFFWKTAQWVRGSVNATFPAQAGDDLKQAGDNHSTDAGNLISDALDQFSSGVSVQFNTQHPSTLRVYQRFESPVRHQHTRIGNDWKYVNGWMWRLSNQGGEWVQTAGDNDAWMLDVVHARFLKNSDGSRGLDDVASTLSDNPFGTYFSDVYQYRPPYQPPNDGLEGPWN
jgi:hypothetical protein